MKKLLKIQDLEINAAGYLVNKKTQEPVNHEVFVLEQKNADYQVRLAEAIKGKNFKITNIDDINKIKAEVLAAINNNTVVYLEDPKAPVSKVNEELKNHALEFIKYQEQVSKNSKINSKMQEFNTTKAICEVGDYFTEGTVRLSKIYTIKEILDAVTILDEKLG